MTDITFVAATNNAGKLEELEALLRQAGCGCTSLRSAGVTCDVEETGRRFSENAAIKARAVRKQCGRAVIADDSGLCVDYLGGKPGIFTARYAGEHSDSEKNMDKLLRELDGVPREERTARFVCAVCAILEDGTEITSVGCLEGRIGTKRLGDGGFGYDPIFRLPNGVGLAQLPDSRKNVVSHRGRAVRKLVFKLRGIKKMRSN